MSTERENGRSIANRRIAGFNTLWRLCILDELEAEFASIGALTPEAVDGVEQNADGMTTANRIVVFLQIGGELGGVHALDDVHTWETTGIVDENVQNLFVQVENVQ